MKLFYITGMFDTLIHGVVFKRKMESEQIQVIILDSPGKGRRKKEKKIDNFNDTVEDLAKELYRKVKDTEPFIILGYSMGAYLSYELYYVLLEKYNICPVHIVFMGMEHPDKQLMKTIHKRTQSFTEYLYNKQISQGSYRKGTRWNKEMENIFFHDLKMYREYKYEPKKIKIQCPVSIFFGNQEYEYNYADKVLPIMQEDLFQQKMNVASFDGDHLFGLIQIPEIKMEVEKIIKRQGEINENI